MTILVLNLIYAAQFIKILALPRTQIIDGEEVERNTQIFNEMDQRAKILSHKTQRKLRIKRVTDAQQAVVNQKNELKYTSEDI